VNGDSFLHVIFSLLNISLGYDLAPHVLIIKFHWNIYLGCLHIMVTLYGHYNGIFSCIP
jgi:hypothetical protein